MPAGQIGYRGPPHFGPPHLAVASDMTPADAALTRGRQFGTRTPGSFAPSRPRSLPMNATSLASSFLLALAQAAPAPESAEPQLLDIDGTVFVMLGLFLVTMFVLTQLLWKPYLRVREERVARVDGYKEEAKRLEAEASTRLANVEAQLGEARRAGSAERARVRAEAVHREQAILASAQAAAQKALAEARGRIETALAGERANLKVRAEALGREAAEIVLGRRVAS